MDDADAVAGLTLLVAGGDLSRSVRRPTGRAAQTSRRSPMMSRRSLAPPPPLRRGTPWTRLRPAARAPGPFELETGPSVSAYRRSPTPTSDLVHVAAHRNRPARTGARRGRLEAALAAQALTRRRDAPSRGRSSRGDCCKQPGYRDDHTREHTRSVAGSPLVSPAHRSTPDRQVARRPLRRSARRHRQARDPRLDPAQAWTLDRGGIPGRQYACPDRRAGAAGLGAGRHPDGRAIAPP